MDDLVQWLGEQLDADAVKARACPGNGEWSAEDIAIYGSDLSPEVRTHMAEHDPARVLREIDAKRRVITGLQHLFRGNDPFVSSIADDSLRVLAEPYEERPGYKDSWRP